MSYKNAMADLNSGGGKAVIIGDSRTPEDAGPVRSLRPRRGRRRGGAYWTAEDVGVSPSDLMHARKSTRYVAGPAGA